MFLFFFPKSYFGFDQIFFFFSIKVLLGLKIGCILNDRVSIVRTKHLIMVLELLLLK